MVTVGAGGEQVVDIGGLGGGDGVAIGLVRIQSESVKDASRWFLCSSQLGTLICLLKDPDEFKGADNGQPGGLYYGSVPQGSDYGQQFWEMDFLTTNGDPTSYLYFKPDGPNVIIKYVDDDGTTGGVANAPVKTESISIQRLVNDYYISQDQKNEVNGYANRIQPEQKWLDRYNLNSSSTDNN